MLQDKKYRKKTSQKIIRLILAKEKYIGKFANVNYIFQFKICFLLENLHPLKDACALNQNPGDTNVIDGFE
jgi:hypothetical protein